MVPIAHEHLTPYPQGLISHLCPVHTINNTTENDTMENFTLVYLASVAGIAGTVLAIFYIAGRIADWFDK